MGTAMCGSSLETRVQGRSRRLEQHRSCCHNATCSTRERALNENVVSVDVASEEHRHNAISETIKEASRRGSTVPSCVGRSGTHWLHGSNASRPAQFSECILQFQWLYQWLFAQCGSGGFACNNHSILTTPWVEGVQRHCRALRPPPPTRRGQSLLPASHGLVVGVENVWQLGVLTAVQGWLCEFEDDIRTCSKKLQN